MPKNRFSALLGGVVVAVAALVATKTVDALTLIPPNFEYTEVQPGETITTKVTIFNESTDVLRTFASTANFGPLDETGTPDIDLTSTTEGLASWIKIEKGPYQVDAGKRLEIPVTMQIPVDADPGGHYAAILFSPEDAAVNGQGSQVAITQKIGSLVLIRVAGTVNESGSILEFDTASGKRSFNRLPVDFILRFQNSGNVHLRPAGNMTVRNMLGGTSIIVPINSNLAAALPSSVRRFDTRWEKSANNEKGNFFSEFGNEWKNFAFGPYTANVVLTYGQANDKTVNATVSFWVMPWRIIILFLVVVALVIWLISMMVKRYNQMIVARATKQPSPPTPKK